MADTTEISWTDATFNPWIGCTRVSPGCDNCYAATLMQDRYQRVKWGPGETRQRTKTWDQPRRWNRLAERGLMPDGKTPTNGRSPRVFCASLADVFDNEVPDEWRPELFELMAETPRLTWLVLTKRIGNAQGWTPWPNVWIGATMVNQDEYDRDIGKLLDVEASVRFISAEPLLGRIVMRRKPVEWVIVGGESGPKARPMNPDWARDLRDQCDERGIAFHFKQWGPRGVAPLLDGREHREFPDALSGSASP